MTEKSSFPTVFAQQAMNHMSLNWMAHPGLQEILKFRGQKYVAPIGNVRKKNLPKIADEITDVMAYFKYQSDLIKKLHEGFYDTVYEIPEEIYCAVIGTPEIAAHKWLNPTAQDAAKLVQRTIDIVHNDPATFVTADTDMQFYYMIDMLDNMLFGIELLKEKRTKIDTTSFNFLKRVADNAKKTDFPKTPLADEIISTLPGFVQEIRLTQTQLQNIKKKPGAKPSI